MSEGVGYTPGSGTTVAADLIDGDLYQRVKVVTGSDGTNLGDVGPTNPLPVSGTVSISGAGAVSGTVSVSGAVGVSGTVTIAPTVFTVNTLAAGFSVNALVTGAVSISAMPAVSGLVSVTGVSLGVVVSGPVSISAMPAVSISVSAVLGTVVTVLGTLAVSQTTVVSGLVSVTGVSLFVVVSGPVSISAMPAVSISVSAILGTIVTIIGMPPVSGVVSISVMPAISISVSAALGTIITILGTQVVSVVPGLAVSISAIAASQTIGTIVTVLGTQIVSVVPGVSVNALVTGVVSVSVLPAISISVSAALGTVITVLGTQIVSVASALLQPVIIMISSTIAASDVTLLMTIYTGATFVTTAASFWVVPVGKVFRVMAMQIVCVSSVTLVAPVRLQVMVGTAAASCSVTSTAGVAAALAYTIPSAVSMQFANNGMVADIAAATTVFIGVFRGSSHFIQGAIIQGYLF